MKLTRRRLFAAVPATLLTPGLLATRAAADGNPTPPPGGKLSFTVWRDGSKVGAHEAVFTSSGDTLSVETHAHFSVGLGPISLYRYTYHVVETWKGGVLQTIAAQTDDNGTRGTCTADRSGLALVVTGSKSGRYTAPAGSIAGTHWNKAELRAPMIDPQNGVQMQFAVADQGSSVPPAGTTAAHHYALTGFATLDLWYDSSDRWVGLRATAKDKSIVDYHAA